MRAGARLIASLGCGALACATLLTGCAAEQDRTLRVFAAASLEGVFTQLAESFEAEHGDLDVELHLAGSSDLVTQIAQGAPADVVATADEPTMQRLVDEGRIAGQPQIFAENTLTVVTAAGNPHGISTLANLAADDLDVVLCAPQVPCGRASQTLLDAAGVTLSPVSEEHQVTDVLGKVTSGQADAGLVYITDAAAAGSDVEGVEPAEWENDDAAVNHYPLGVLEDSAETATAEDFVDHVLSDEGRRVLEEAGFAVPDDTAPDETERAR